MREKITETVTKISASVSPSAGIVYAYIYNHPKCSVYEIARETGLSIRTVIRALQELRKKYYISRYRDQETPKFLYFVIKDNNKTKGEKDD